LNQEIVYTLGENVQHILSQHVLHAPEPLCLHICALTLLLPSSSGQWGHYCLLPHRSKSPAFAAANSRPGY